SRAATASRTARRSRGDAMLAVRDPEPAQWITKEPTVGDLMNPDVVTVYAGDPALAAVAEMARRNIHRVVVLDDESEPIGIVTPMDVVRALDRGWRFEAD